MHAQSVSLAGVTVWLRSDRTAWLPPDQAGGVADGAAGHASAGTEWPAGGTLLVADVHLGKAHQFSALGVPLPASARSGADGDTLARLAAALYATAARRLVVLGDLFHGPQGGDSPARFARAMAAWAAGRPGDLPTELVLIGGNHDTRARADLSALQGLLGERLICLPEEGHWRHGLLACAHHPEPVAGAGYTLSGHLHPCVHVQAPGRDRLRLPCFWLGDAGVRPVGVLPAFGAFTGMHPIRPAGADQVWAVTPQGLHRLPA